jgi:4a-hydroxytetrahydrobiopterin dehydratase
MSPLHLQLCLKPDQGLVQLSESELHDGLQLLSQWQLLEDQPVLQREFRFKDYYQTLAFVNAVGWIAHQQDHHPELVVNYNRCRVRFTTHAVNGISINDLICAAKIDQLDDSAEE